MTDRVQVGLKVPKQIKKAFEDKILENRVQTRPYAGTELERELRIAFDEGRDSDMYNSLRSLVDETARKKNSVDLPKVGGVKQVNYRIDPGVRAELERVAAEGVASMSRIVASVMFHYAIDEGYQDQMRDYVQELGEDDPGEDLSTTERKKQDIADYLRENNTDEGANVGEFVLFHIEDFDDAVREAADNLSPGKYAREKFLKPVLEKLDAECGADGTYMSERNDRDPRGLPYESMTEKEAKTAIKAEALQNFRSGGAGGQIDYITISDAASVLGTSNRVGHRLLKEIDDPKAGFTYKADVSLSDEPILKVNQSRAKEWEYRNGGALELAGILEKDDPEESEPEGEEFQETSETQVKPAGVIAD